MTSTSVRPGNYSNRPKTNPNAVAIASFILPGLGQLMNGQSRKGVMLMGAGIANLALFWSMVFNAQILGILNSFADTFHMRPNADLDKVLRECSLGTPVSLILIGFFLAYMCFAARDAYEHAAQRRRKLYPDYVIDLPEATSGAYMAHFATMAALLLIAFLFILPPPRKSQITEIEFVTDQEEVKEKVQSQRKAQKSSKDSGKHDPTKKVAPPSPSANKASQKSAQQQPKQPSAPSSSAPPRPAAPTPRAVAPSPAPSPSPSPAPRPMAPTPMAPRMPSAPAPPGMVAPNPMPTPTAPQRMPTNMPTFAPSLTKAPGMPTLAPMAKPTGGTANGLPTIAPSPVGIASAAGVPGFAPMPTGGVTKGGGSFAGAAPAPVVSGGGGGTGGSGRGAPTPVPVNVGGGSRQGTGGGGPAAAPAPTRATAGGGGGGWGSGPVVVTPSVPKGGGAGGGDGAAGNPGPNSNPNGRPSVAAQADVDFGPYMADLQRRIKKCWFPPRGNESKRVVVVFKVHTDGTLSDLRIDKGSGVPVADQAALKAVNDAAPFRPLPSGAPSDVDIQFTFDYNVFGGGGTGRFRQF